MLIPRQPQKWGISYAITGTHTRYLEMKIQIPDLSGWRHGFQQISRDKNDKDTCPRKAGKYIDYQHKQWLYVNRILNHPSIPGGVDIS